MIRVRLPASAAIQRRRSLWSIAKQGEEIPATVHDESLGGFGLLLSAPPSYAVGQDVTIVFASSIFTGTLSHVEQQEDGRYLAGFRCEPLCVVRNDLMTDCRQDSADCNSTAEVLDG